MYNDVNFTTYRIVDYTHPVVRNIIKEVDKYHQNVGKQLLHRGHLIKVIGQPFSLVILAFPSNNRVLLSTPHNRQASSAIMFDSVYAFARGLHQFSKNSHSKSAYHQHHSYTVEHQLLPLKGGFNSEPGGSGFSGSQFGNPPYAYDAIPIAGPLPEAGISSIFGSIFGSSSSSVSASSNSPSSNSLTSLNSYASCSNETPWTNGLSLYNYIDSVRHTLPRLKLHLN